MSNEFVQADYDKLQEIADLFSKHGEENQAMQARIVKIFEALRDGGWEGRGAEAYFAEMDGVMMPAATRLHEALREANRVTTSIAAILQQAEEEAAAPFRGSNGRGGPGLGGGISTGQPVGGIGGSLPGGGVSTGQPVGGSGGSLPGSGVSTGQPVGGSGGSIPTSSQEYVVQNPSELFKEDYMRDFIGSQYEGAGNGRLNELMEHLVFNDTGNVEEMGPTLDEIADLRGVDRAEFREQYSRYRELLANANAIGGNEPYIDVNRHPNFLGSTVSLRYGDLVGETFGVDPVFGSLLNPTGGMVGPGDDAYVPGDNDAIGYHGTFHDAAGYLYNYHNVGPGYDYMGREPFPTGNPLSGQVGGISWWSTQPGLEIDVLPNLVPDIPYVPSFVERGAAEIIEGPVVAVGRIATSTVEGGADIVDGIGDVFTGDFSEGLDDIGSGAGIIVRGFGRSVLDLFD
ncbi:MAG: WXG100 family type VII secretion target [Ardenticatenaceae bacterium]|nr:WXG100 family type VII secretion target [Ardenticatenaceae bacterium]